jgi:hypothetical protein
VLHEKMIQRARHTYGQGMKLDVVWTQPLVKVPGFHVANWQWYRGLCSDAARPEIGRILVVSGIGAKAGVGLPLALQEQG